MLSEPDFPTDLQALERDYELIRELGQGGMAAVYLARRRDSNRLVAIKAVRARYLDDPDALQRFAREARVVADLDHPNIVRTEAIEQIDDRAVAIIMEYVAGGTVRDRLREYGAFDAERAETVLRDVANALAYAHRRGIVHRDVKPENVFLDELTGRALLSDFGIARKIDGDPAITQLGAALGTPQYMSPEQIDGGNVDGRSDIYSLGVLGWELLTGRRPWAGENLYGVIYKQKHEDLPRITELRPRVPANLLFAIERALVKDRTQRWQSIEEFLDRLTYNAPPVLAQAYPPGPRSTEDEPTMQFRPVLSDGLGPREDVRTTSAPPARPVGATPPSAAPITDDEPPLAPEPRRIRDDAADMDRSSATPRWSIPERARKTVPPRARAAPRTVRGVLTRRPILRGLALLIPLLVAAGSLYVVLDGGGRGASSAEPNGGVTSSAGSVALDSARAADSAGSKRAALPPVQSGDTTRAVRPPSPQPRDTASAVNSINTNTARTTTAPPESASRQPASPRQRTQAKADDPFGRPPVSRTPGAAEPAATRAASTPSNASTAAPSARCAKATMADQRACLLAHITVNDAPLQRTYDALIGELRRIAGARRGAPDPPGVTRLRVEQRAWIVQRDRECTRNPAPGSVPLWAEPLSECFAQMSKARADELGEALARARRQ